MNIPTVVAESEISALQTARDFAQDVGFEASYTEDGRSFARKRIFCVR
jgi:hypothetical protein